MPFFSPGTPCDWARLYMVCYIGLNKHLGEPQNKKKYDPVMQLMDYISTPEGQLALAADTGISIQALLTETRQSRTTITPVKDGRFIIR